MLLVSRRQCKVVSKTTTKGLNGREALGSKLIKRSASGQFKVGESQFEILFMSFQGSPESSTLEDYT